MRRFLAKITGIVIFFIATAVNAQFSNQWINHSQTYYRIPVAKEGVYRLTYADLQNAGFPVNSVDPRLIQIFHRGTEQAIFFKHDQLPADSKFDATEYLEFFGQKNDGTLDSRLYQPNSAQPHAYYNLYSDTTAYFLTWNLLPIQGKRISSFSEVNVDGLTKEASQINTQLVLYTQEYSGGETIGDLIQSSYFNQGEGWTGNVICTGSSGCAGQQDFVINNLTGVVASAGNPQLEIQLAGRDDLLHYAEIYVGQTAGSLRLVGSSTFQNFETPTVQFTLVPSDIGSDGNMTARVKVLGVNGGRDRMSVSYIKVRFDQDFDLANQSEKKINLKPNSANKSYVELLNTPSNSRFWDITDTDNIVSIGTSTNANITSAVVANTSVQRSIFISNQFYTPSVSKVSFRKINPGAHNFLIVTHPSLVGQGLGYSDVIKAYASYRASTEGGSYDTLSVTIDQLYNQFNFGETSPLAIYEFMKFMYSGGKLKYLFLVGKGREANSGFHRKTTLASGEFRDLVPVAGFPSSDLTYSAGLSGVPHLPAVATGRITASTPAQVAAYLNKVKETEAASFNDFWHKQVLHLSGGIQPAELTLFRQFMNDFERKAEDDFYGGSVKTLGKHEANAIELINISGEVNKGVNLVTFFGHSAPNATDIDIGYASDPIQGYTNSGKYPAFLVNGCSAGEFFLNGTNFAEDWILTTGRGARNFIANSSYGFDFSLKYYTDLFYEYAFNDSVGIRSGIGNIQLKVAEKFLNSSTTIASLAMTQQMVLLGDPALKIFGAGKPDFEIKDQGLSATGFDGKPVAASADSFALKMIIKNFGLTTPKKLPIRVVQKFPDGLTVTHDSLFIQPLYQDTLTFRIKRKSTKNFANSVFTVLMDKDNVIDELNEQNNSASFTLLIPGTRNLFPDDYSIVPHNEVELVFLNTNQTASTQSYLVEIDTIKSFNSTVIQKFTLSGRSLLRQKVNLLDKDSTVYYWRTRLSTSTDADWQTTSFSYIKNSDIGWTQMRFSQFDDNGLNGLVKDPVVDKLEYKETFTSIFVKTFGKDNISPVSNAAFTVNGVDYWHSMQGFNCRNNTLNLVAFNKNTVVPYEGIPFTYLNAHGRACGREPQLINSFLTSETETGNNDDLIQYVDNISVGDSVLLFTLGDAGMNLYSSNVKTKLGEFGISIAQMDALIPGEPVVIFGRKGAIPGTAKIIRTNLAPETAQELIVSDTLTGRFSSGSMNSVLIGPAQSWRKLESQIAEQTINDLIRFDLYGIRMDGIQSLIQANVGNTFDLSGISATLYPQLKLVYSTEDNTDLTAAQLKKWFVFFDPVAEGMIFYRGPFTQQIFQEGLSWTGDYSFVNLSSTSFKDSLKVEVNYFNKKTDLDDLSNFKIKAPAQGDSTLFRITNYPKAGLNDVNVFVNRRFEPELYYENNSLNLIDYLNVKADDIRPVLEVTFDGRFIQNGDYVSSTPSIVLLMKDENPYFFKKDTLGVDLFLKSPCAASNCGFNRIFLKSNELKWTAASATNDFKIEFNPANLVDGEYTLQIQIKDATGNAAGIEPYTITFNVLNETTITMPPVYPNPSSFEFVFRFVTTGQHELDHFALQIWSADGRIMRSFNEDDLDARYVGTHEVRWNATNFKGDLLRPGIYFYKLEVGINDERKASYGKLAVVR